MSVTNTWPSLKKEHTPKPFTPYSFAKSLSKVVFNTVIFTFLFLYLSLNILFVPLSCILCSTDFLMIEIIYDDWMSLWHPAVGHFIINKGTVILLCHFFGFFFQSFEIAAVVLVIDFVIKRHKARMFLCYVIHNRLFEATPKIEVSSAQKTLLPRTVSTSASPAHSASASIGARCPTCRLWHQSFRISCWRKSWNWMRK